MYKQQSGSMHVVLAVVIFVLVLGAVVANFVLRGGKDEGVSSRSNTASTTLAGELPGDLLGIDKIKELAAAEGGTEGIASVELQNEEGTYLYKVKLPNGNVLFFNARSGTKVVHASGENETEDGTIPASFTPSISFSKAREIALGQKTGGTIRKIELELEEGKVVYSVRFTDDARIDVDATSGAIVRTKAPKTTQPTSGSNSGTGSQSSGSSNSGSGSGTSGSSNSGSSSNSTPSPSTSSDDDSTDDPDDSDDDSSDDSDGSHRGRGSDDT